MTVVEQPTRPRRVPPGGEGLVGLTLAEAEATLQARGLTYLVEPRLPPGAAMALGPFRNRLMLHRDDQDIVTDVSVP